MDLTIALVATDAPGARALSALRDDSHPFLVTALVSNNVANITAASVATAVFVRFGFSGSEAATGSMLVTSVFVIVFGEIAPKSYAVANAEKHAFRVSRIVVAIQRVLRPVLYVFEALSGVVNRFTGGESDIESYLTREEIATLARSGEAAGALDPDEDAMIRGVLDLETTTVAAVMVPRTDVVALPETPTPADALSRPDSRHPSSNSRTAAYSGPDAVSVDSTSRISSTENVPTSGPPASSASRTASAPVAFSTRASVTCGVNSWSAASTPSGVASASRAPWSAASSSPPRSTPAQTTEM